MMADDIADLIRSLELGCDVYTRATETRMDKLRGIVVTQRQNAPAPDHLTRTDTTYFDIRAVGEGGDRGRRTAYALAQKAYEGLNLVMDWTAPSGAYYVRIYPDSAPYEIPTGTGEYDYGFGLEAVRYYG